MPLSGRCCESLQPYGFTESDSKAQVHTGGRGKAGGVKLATDEIELRRHAASILGMDIKGFKVDRILIGEAVNISKEYYVSYVIDRNSKSTILMLSKEGGMDIEEVARSTPEKKFTNL